MAVKQSENFIAIPPGKSIKEIMERREIPFNLMAEQLNLTGHDFYDLLEGDFPLTEKIADGLQYIFGGSSTFWINSEKRYREDLKKVNEENNSLHYEMIPDQTNAFVLETA